MWLRGAGEVRGPLAPPQTGCPPDLPGAVCRFAEGEHWDRRSALSSSDSDGLLPTSLRPAEGQGFLSPPLQDVQNKLKESAQCLGDEFMNCRLAARAKVLT